MGRMVPHRGRGGCNAGTVAAIPDPARPIRPVLAAAHGAAAAAALARELEAAGVAPAEPLALADGGPGTLGVLLPALGGETRGADLGPGAPPAAFALVEDGGTALLEPLGTRTQALVDAAAAAGPQVVVVLAAGIALEPLTATPGVTLVVLGEHDGPAFVLDALDADDRLRAAAALRLGDDGPCAALLAARARALGVPLR